MRAETAIQTAQFGAALLLSVALHVPVYLFLAQWRENSPSAPLRIEASVVMGETPAPEAPQNAPVQPARAAQPKISAQVTVPLPAPAPAPKGRPPESANPDQAASNAPASGGGVRARLLSSAETEPAMKSQNEFVVAPPVPGDENAPLPFATAPGPSSPAHPDQRAGAGGPYPDGGGARNKDDERALHTVLEAYGRRLVEQTMAEGRYPSEAIARGWQGKVLLLLRFGKGGALLEVDVRQSSGYAILDSEAVEMAKRANTQTPIPAILQERKFVLTIPVTFRLGASLFDEKHSSAAAKTE